MDEDCQAYMGEVGNGTYNVNPRAKPVWVLSGILVEVWDVISYRMALVPCGFNREPYVFFPRKWIRIYTEEVWLSALKI